MTSHFSHNLSLYLILFLGMSLFLSCINNGKNSYEEAFKDPDLSVEERVDDLLSRMRLEEKVSQMVNDAPAIERLGIPEYNWWNECLHGVGRAGLATVFPQAIGLAATWNPDLMYQVANVISDEARAKHHAYLRKGKRGIYQGLTFWTPNINIFRDPRWGRGMETYGEDPFLTGKMAVEFINGLQGKDPHYLKLVATAKHYAVHSGPEEGRHEFDSITDMRDLLETYLPHFRETVVNANVQSVMCAYNRYMGKACCGSSPLLKDILRDQWGFEGYVVSDCGAIRDIFAHHKIVQTSPEAAALSVKSGTDLNCGKEYKNLLIAVEQDLITEDEIDVSLRRLFRARFKLGMFDPEERVPFAHIPYSVVDSKDHQKLALEAARQSMVLLKNDNNTLPLRKDLSTIAVIGPNANDVEVLLGNYNGIPSNPITPLKGIQDKVSKNTNVLYALGTEWAENLPVFEVVPTTALFTTKSGNRTNGLKADYFNNRDFEGEPALTRIDDQINFNWWEEAPADGFDSDNFAVRWTGELVPQISGLYHLGAEGLNGFRLFVDDSLFVKYESPDHAIKTYEAIELKAGQPYKIKVEFYERSGNAQMKLLWAVPGQNYEKEAIEIAKQADTVIMVMGLSPRLEGEEMKVKVDGFKGGDRLNLKTPAAQEDLLKKIQQVGKPVVLVLMNGSAVAINWASENIPAIVEAWYPGQAAGQAVADVLFGDYNPGGRLPVTFYQSIDQLPPFEDYNMKGRTYRYFEGKPLYPFGFGLSYTQFHYSNLNLPQTVDSEQDIAISVDVENSGNRAGDEVVQLYVRDVDATVPVPIRSLQGVQKIFIKPGEKKTVRFTLTPRQYSLINNNFSRIIEPGLFEITIGGKQPGFTGRADAHTTDMVTGRFEFTGEIVYLD